MGVGAQDRASDRQVIGRRACRSGYDEAVATVGCQLVAVEQGVDRYHRGIVVADDGYLVESVREIKDARSVVDAHAPDSHSQQRSLLNHKASLGDVVYYAAGILDSDIAEESEVSAVQAENGGRHRADPAGCAQEGAVAADADSQLGRCGAESDNSGWQILGAESQGIAVLHSYGGMSESFPETGYKVESGPATRRILTPFAVYGY